MKLENMHGSGPCAPWGLWVRIPPSAQYVQTKTNKTKKCGSFCGPRRLRGGRPQHDVF